MEARELDALEALLEWLQRPDARETVAKLLELLDNLEKSGLLDLLIAVTNPEVVERLYTIIVTTGTMRLADRLDALLDTLGTAAASLAEDPGDPPSLSQILRELGDPQVRRGLARLVAFLRALGRG